MKMLCLLIAVQRQKLSKSLLCVLIAFNLLGVRHLISLCVPFSFPRIIDFGLSKKYLPNQTMREGVGTVYTVSQNKKLIINCMSFDMIM